jgi:16S rRNA C1402 (ribose-2'-O) methylase RsmI
LEGSLVVYESPNRAVDFASMLAEELPDREVCLCREMTKMHEEIISLPAPLMAENLAARERIRGEVVFVIGPGQEPAVQEDVIADDRLKSIAKALASRWSCSAKEAYQALLELEEGRSQR